MITRSVVPLSEVPPDRLRDFLQQRGMTREVVEWRYLDADFNRGRNRGYAWLRQGRVEGMIGLIPFQIRGGGSLREANWSSDWMTADPAANPGMGSVLLRRAIEESGYLIALGGNQNTRQILPRVANQTVADAGMAFHLVLRAGAILRTAERRGVLARGRLPRLLYQLPLRWPTRRASSDLKSEPVLSPRIAPLLEADAPEEGWSPRYDFNYLDWQIGRSPLLRCFTTYAPAEGAAQAAVVCWRPASSADFWRLAVWYRPGHVDRVGPVLQEAIARIRGEGGFAVSALTSRLEPELRKVLRSAGFLLLGRRPLYLCIGKNGHPISELRRLSYLDSDLGYRF